MSGWFNAIFDDPWVMTLTVIFARLVLVVLILVALRIALYLLLGPFIRFWRPAGARPTGGRGWLARLGFAVSEITLKSPAAEIKLKQIEERNAATFAELQRQLDEARQEVNIWKARTERLQAIINLTYQKLVAKGEK